MLAIRRRIHSYLRAYIMSYLHLDRSLSKVAVVGSGQIGPDIALYFTKVLSPHGVQTVVVDVSDDALAKGSAKLQKKVNKGDGSRERELALKKEQVRDEAVRV